MYPKLTLRELIVYKQNMPTLLMTTIRLILISVLLNAAMVGSEHQLSHITQSHTIEECDVCSHSSDIDDITIATSYSFLEFTDNNQILLSVFSVGKQRKVKTHLVRAPPILA